MLITTQDELVDHEIVETLGLVRGNTIRARHVGKDILAVIRMLIGGEITEYTKMLAEAREQAFDRMKAEAKRKGADGIVCVRFTRLRRKPRLPGLRSRGYFGGVGSAGSAEVFVGATAVKPWGSTTSAVMQGAAELLAYGTAVKLARR